MSPPRPSQIQRLLEEEKKSKTKPKKKKKKAAKATSEGGSDKNMDLREKLRAKIAKLSNDRKDKQRQTDLARKAATASSEKTSSDQVRKSGEKTRKPISEVKRDLKLASKKASLSGAEKKTAPVSGGSDEKNLPVSADPTSGGENSASSAGVPPEGKDSSTKTAAASPAAVPQSAADSKTAVSLKDLCVPEAVDFGHLNMQKNKLDAMYVEPKKGAKLRRVEQELRDAEKESKKLAKMSEDDRARFAHDTEMDVALRRAAGEKVKGAVGSSAVGGSVGGLKKTRKLLAGKKDKSREAWADRAASAGEKKRGCEKVESGDAKGAKGGKGRKGGKGKGGKSDGKGKGGKGKGGKGGGKGKGRKGFEGTGGGLWNKDKDV